MTKKITLIFLTLISSISFGQTVINDFEDNSPTAVQRYGANISIVANPNTNGNTSANVIKLGRTSGNWYELFAFDLASPYDIPAGETHYLSFMVNYPAQPDISVRFDAASSAGDGSGSQRAINAYDAASASEWQKIAFEVEGGSSGKTVNAIVFLGDVGFENEPAGQVLDNSDNFGYIDDFTFSEANPLSVASLEINKSNVTIFPNTVKSTFKIQSNNNVNSLSIYNVLGKDLTSNIVKIDGDTYDISNFPKGVYILKVNQQENNIVTKRILKQ